MLRKRLCEKLQKNQKNKYNKFDKKWESWPNNKNGEQKMKKIILAILTMALLIAGVCLLNASQTPVLQHIRVHNVDPNGGPVTADLYEYPYGNLITSKVKYPEPNQTVVVFEFYTPLTSGYYAIIEQGDRSVNTGILPPLGGWTDVWLPSVVYPTDPDYEE